MKKEKEMKRLIYLTHADADEEASESLKFLSLAGLDLARDVGLAYRAMSDRFGIDCVFHGPHVCTAQTAASFIVGHGHVGRVAPVVPQIGTKEFLSEITSPSTFRALAASGGNIHAMLACHGEAKVRGWTENSRAGVSNMFAQLGEGELGVAFGHRPVIELVLCSVKNTFDLSQELFCDCPLEGVELSMSPKGRLQLVSKILAL
jgi:hypothetical protein